MRKNHWPATKILIFAVLFGLLHTAAALGSGPDFNDTSDGSNDLAEDVLERLDEPTSKLMDEKGEEILREVMEKDDLGKNMKNETRELRTRTLKETARTLALQKAVKWRYGKIRSFLKKQESTLDDIFDFAPLLMHGGRVLPPVITEAGPGYRIESESQASSVNKVYRIIKTARIVSRAPDWRDYLIRTYPAFDESDVNVGVLPKNDKEREMWKKAAAGGWKDGVRQAERLYQHNLHELKRDYSGIVKFKTLAEQGLVSLPTVAEGKHGIEVQGKKLSIERKVFRITRPGTFQKEEHWKPRIGAE